MLSKQYQLLRIDGVRDLHNMELIKACKNNNELLGDFLTANRDFIFSILVHYKGNIEELRIKFKVSEDELYQHACIGVITALKDFDFNRGIKFTTYVVRPIIWEVNQLLYSDSQCVRLSRGAVDLIKRMAEIEDNLGYRPNEEEMASLLHIKLDRYREIAMFTDEIEHYDAHESFDIEDKHSITTEEKVTNKLYVAHLLNDAMFTVFEKQIMHLILADSENNNTQIASKLNVYPMTINRTLARIRSKIERKETNGQEANKHNAISKYAKEIYLISQESKERKEPLNINEMIDLLEVCGFDTSVYTTRILYYIRQKAVAPDLLAAGSF